jgi:predicted ribosomally synthesized peptide with SipW-like signal peptide
MATRNNKKLALSVLGLGAATAAVVFGSWASWTAQTTNPGNQVTAGTLTMANEDAGSTDSDGNPVLTTNVTNIKPGDTDSDTVTLRNDGSVDMSSVKLSLTNAAGFSGDTSNLLQFRIHDDTTDRCIVPSDAAGSCSGWDDWDTGANFSNFTIKTAAGATDVWTADPDGAGAGTGEEHTFTIEWQFTNGGTADNDSQGDTATFDLTWDGVI